MSELTQQIQEARRALADAKIAARVAFSQMATKDIQLTALSNYRHAAQGRQERAEAELECLLNERREQEQERRDNIMNELTQQIQKARRALADAKIAAREASEDHKAYLLSLQAGVDYASLGKNEKAREVAFAQIIAEDTRAAELWNYLRACLAREELRRTELECLLDERREQEQKTWAKLADYLIGRVDHIGYAPTQTVREAAREAVWAQTSSQVDELDELPF